MKNIVQLYFDNDKKLPFIVRRGSWSDSFALLITSVKPRKTSNGWFGDVIGFGLPPLRGNRQNSYWGTPGNPKKVSCSGCYQWELVTDVHEKWQTFFAPNDEVDE